MRRQLAVAVRRFDPPRLGVDQIDFRPALDESGMCDRLPEKVNLEFKSVLGEIRSLHEQSAEDSFVRGFIRTLEFAVALTG